MGSGQSHTVWDALDALAPKPQYYPYGQTHPTDDAYSWTGHEQPSQYYTPEPELESYESPPPKIDWKRPLRKGLITCLLFPADANTPRLVQMPYEVHLDGADCVDGDRSIYWQYKQRTGIAEYIPGDRQLTFVTHRRGERGISPQNNNQLQSLGRILEVLHPWYDENSELPPPNQCIMNLTKGSSNPSPKWYGNVLVTRVVGMNESMHGLSSFNDDIAEDFDEIKMEEDLVPMVSFFKTFKGEQNSVKIIHKRKKDSEFWFPGLPVGLRYWKHELCTLPSSHGRAISSYSYYPPGPDEYED